MKTLAEVQGLQEQNQQAIDALTTAKVAIPTELTLAAEGYAKEIASRQSEVLSTRIEEMVAKHGAKFLKDVDVPEIGLAVLSEYKPDKETGEFVWLHRGVKPKKSRTSSTGSGGKKGKYIYIVNGIPFNSGAEAVRDLKDKKIIKEETGAGNSAPRTLLTLLSSGLISSYERKSIVEEEAESATGGGYNEHAPVQAPAVPAPAE